MYQATGEKIIALFTGIIVSSYWRVSAVRLKTTTLPISFSVNQTWSPRGAAAMLGQNGEGCATRPATRRVRTSKISVWGVKLEHT